MYRKQNECNENDIIALAVKLLLAIAAVGGLIYAGIKLYEKLTHCNCDECTCDECDFENIDECDEDACCCCHHGENGEVITLDEADEEESDEEAEEEAETEE